MKRSFTIALGVASLLALADARAARAQQPSEESASAKRKTAEVESVDPRREQEEGALGTRSRSGAEGMLVDRPDRKRPKDAFFVNLFGRPLTFGGRMTQRTSYLANEPQEFDEFILTTQTDDSEDLDLDGENDELEEVALGKIEEDDTLKLRQEIEVDASYPITDSILFYAALKANYVARVMADHGRRVPVFGTPDTLLVPGPGTFFVDDEFGDRAEFSRDESWLYFGGLFDTPFSLQVGRQRFTEDREWWWDRDFDSIRLRFDSPAQKLHAELAVAEDLLPITVDDHGREVIKPADKNILRLFGQASWEWAPRQTLGLFALHQRDHSSSLVIGDCNRDLVRPGGFGQPLPPGDNIDDRTQTFLSPPPAPLDGGCISDSDADESDANLTWFGMSTDGRAKLEKAGSLYYWGQLSGVVGNETFFNFDSRGISQRKGVYPYQRRVASVFENDILGFGADLGLTLETRLPGKPRFTVGYAYGSGDSGSSDENDEGFRQTGLQDDNDKFRGVDSFRYYGELLDPELSNLHIATAALGFPLLRNSSIELVYHYYRQVEAVDHFRNVSFGRDPNSDPTIFGAASAGNYDPDPDIGQEWDLILGIEEWERWEIELIGGVFKLGDAFEPRDGNLAYLAELQFRFNF